VYINLSPFILSLNLKGAWEEILKRSKPSPAHILPSLDKRRRLGSGLLTNPKVNCRKFAITVVKNSPIPKHLAHTYTIDIGVIVRLWPLKREAGQEVD